ncbi:macro domain-containing protein [Streptomyces actinomycinicus]|uniref:macro domain-containing protein n=1 Tax=Streptomyces actinomycinicus TaxID=1695166 RepID=UPI0027DA4CE6|nr:macro domain-containing protein [Streptomyces actinomycinicus]
MQLVVQLFSLTFSEPLLVIAFTVTLSVAWGLTQALPPASAARSFGHPGMRVQVIVGDLFEQRGHIVVGFTDTFDTCVADDLVISRSSVQAQLLQHWYAGSQEDLDDALTAALERSEVEAVESRADKPHGKLERYPVGTVAVLSRNGRKAFGLAYSRLGNSLVAESSAEKIWVSLCRLWEAVYEHGHREPLALPIIGGALARVDTLSQENLLKMILLSFAAASRARVVTRELTVVIHPTALHDINVLEIRHFLMTL